MACRCQTQTGDDQYTAVGKLFDLIAKKLENTDDRTAFDQLVYSLVQTEQNDCAETLDVKLAKKFRQEKDSQRVTGGKPCFSLDVKNRLFVNLMIIYAVYRRWAAEIGHSVLMLCACVPGCVCLIRMTTAKQARATHHRGLNGLHVMFPYTTRNNYLQQLMCLHALITK